jgi:hypothetical protein
VSTVSTRPAPTTDAQITAADNPQKATNPWILIFGLYLIVLNLVLIYLLFRIWPGKVPVSVDPARVTIIPGYFDLSLWPEARYLSIVAIDGALGAYIHLATSFTEFLGNRNFYSSWK